MDACFVALLVTAGRESSFRPFLPGVKIQLCRYVLNDITVLVSGEQKHYFHLWGLQKPLDS
jgi:hypothetical protein